MREIVVVTGTGTEVGKTFVTARLIEILRAEGLTVAARKPVQSFDPAGGPTDAEILATASGESPHEVCPAHRWYELAMAPPMAAESLGRPPFALADLIAETALPVDGVVFVEGVGGPRSPVAADADTVAIAAALRADRILLVSAAGLGAINAILLARDAFAAPVTVYLNRFDPDDELHQRNRAWLTERCSLDVATHVGDLARSLPSETPQRTLEVR